MKNKTNVCPKCGSKNITYSNEVNTRSRGIVFKLVSLTLAVCTLGLSLLITNNMRKITTKNRVVGICQNCGYKFNVK
jgi:predicted nucleic-acid-binding Zn-ribbon protein